MRCVSVCIGCLALEGSWVYVHSCILGEAVNLLLFWWQIRLGYPLRYFADVPGWVTSWGANILKSLPYSLCLQKVPTTVLFDNVTSACLRLHLCWCPFRTTSSFTKSHIKVVLCKISFLDHYRKNYPTIHIHRHQAAKSHHHFVEAKRISIEMWRTFGCNSSWESGRKTPWAFSAWRIHC